ncbi:MAG TPA: ATP synthase F0 subunit B [Ilumatobacter sp.]|nr:ATP synthase F0 subunit B [Ilumatobacter sp.]
MLTAVVTRGATIEVVFVQAEEAEGEHGEAIDCEFPEKDAEGHETGVCEEGPSPIAPEVKELAWGAGSFIVLALLMRFLLFPKLKAGMDARYAHIRGGHEQADTARASAKAEVAQYESALATVKAEANERVDAARQTLEAERAARLGQANAAIAAKREAAAAETRAAREAANADIAAAVASVTSRTVELSIGKAPEASVVNDAVNGVMTAGVGS